MGQIIFTVHDARTSTGYRHIAKVFDSLELAIDYMHKYHNRSTSYYHWIEDGKAYGYFDKIGVQR